MRRFRHLLGAMLSCILALLLALGTWACSTPSAAPQDAQATSSAGTVQVEHGSSYTSTEDVAAYLHEYKELPPNFISKTKAKKAGWVPSEGNLDEVCPGMSIGGSVFYNDDGKLPDAEGRTWHECDIDYHGGMRGPERIVWSTDSLIYYTPDHYETFEQLY